MNPPWTFSNLPLMEPGLPRDPRDPARTGFNLRTGHCAFIEFRSTRRSAAPVKETVLHLWFTVGYSHHNAREISHVFQRSSRVWLAKYTCLDEFKPCSSGIAVRKWCLSTPHKNQSWCKTALYKTYKMGSTSSRIHPTVTWFQPNKKQKKK